MNGEKDEKKEKEDSIRAFKFDRSRGAFQETVSMHETFNDPSILSALFREDLEKKNVREMREYGNSLIEAKISRRFGNMKHFGRLGRIGERLGMVGLDEALVEGYFDCWSRIHTVYCHYNASSSDVNSMVYHVIYDESGEYILSASTDRLIKVYSKDLNLLHTIKGHGREVSILALSSDNKHLVSVDDGGLVRVWTFPEGRLASFRKVCCSPHGTGRTRDQYNDISAGNSL